MKGYKTWIAAGLW